MFHDKVKNMEKLGKCFGRMDLAILLDGSGSIREENYKLAQGFVSNLVDTFSLTNVNLGFVVFSEIAEIIYPFESNLTQAQMKTKIMNSAYPNGGTNTSGAINTATNMLLKTTQKEGSPRIMAIFTDGEPNNLSATISAADTAAKANINVFAIGIGAGINQANLLAMVQKQLSHVFTMSSYKSLSESFEMMNMVTCQIPQVPHVGKKVEDTLTKNEKRFFCYDLLSIGITISIDIKMGKTDAFYSYTLQNPSSALNDGNINGKTFIPIPQSTNRSKRDLSIKRVCVTVEGLEIHNNFIINSEEGDKSVTPATSTTVSSDNGDPINIKKRAQAIAKKAFETLKNYNQIANQICNDLSKTYDKYEWICVVGEKVEISEHMLPKSLFQFGFTMNTADIFIIVNMPD